MAAPEVFDADARAKERESAGLKLGGVVYKRRRRNNKLMREVRRLGRRQDEKQKQLDELSRTADIERLEERRDALEAERDAEDGPDPARVAVIAAQLVDIRTELAEIEAGLDNDAIEELEDEVEGSLYRSLELLLGPAKDGTELTADQLAEELDFEDAVALSSQLMKFEKADKAGGEPDPT